MKYPNQFKEGNPIYCPTVTHRICQVKFMGVDKLRIDEETPFQIYTNGCNPYHMPVIFHATQQNYELLSKLYPNVSFEPPPKRKEPREIILAMLKAGHKYILCEVYCSGDYRDYYGTDSIIGIDENDGRFIGGTKEHYWETAIPINSKGQKIIDFVNGEVVLESEDD